MKTTQVRKKILRIKCRSRTLQQNEDLIILLEDDTIEEICSLFIVSVEREWDARLLLLKEGDYLLYEEGNLVGIQYQTGEKWSYIELRDKFFQKKKLNKKTKRKNEHEL